MLRTACPELRGLMSRKASVFSLSKSFKDGISPVSTRSVSSLHYASVRVEGDDHTLDDFAEDTRGRH